MPIVPTLPASAQPAPSGPRPSPAQLLMALATMKDLGRLDANQPIEPPRYIGKSESANSPSEVYHSELKDGASKNDARAAVIKGYKKANPNMSDEDIERYLAEQPGS